MTKLIAIFIEVPNFVLYINIYNLTPVESNSDESKFRLSRIKVLVPRSRNKPYKSNLPVKTNYCSTRLPNPRLPNTILPRRPFCRIPYCRLLLKMTKFHNIIFYLKKILMMCTYLIESSNFSRNFN